MNIAIISPYRFEDTSELPDPGQSALNWYTRRLAHGLVDAGAGVTIIGPKTARRSASPWSDGAIRVLPTYVRGSGRAWIDIASGVDAARPDVVHLEHELFAYGGALSASTIPLAVRRIRQKGLKVLSTIHGVIPLDHIDRAFVRANKIPAPPRLARTVWRLLLKSVARASDAVHVHEQHLADFLRGEYGLSRLRIEVIPMGVVSVGEKPNNLKARTEIGVPPDARVALFFGFLSAYKGIREFLRDLPAAMTNVKNLYVIIAGEVPTRLRGSLDLADEMENLGIDKSRVRLLGFVPDTLVPSVFGAADVLVLPYSVAMSASGPMSLALSYGLPVLLSAAFASAYPGAPAMFRLSKGEIAAALSRFFGQPDVRQASTEYCAGLAADRRWPQIAVRMQEVYRSL